MANSRYRRSNRIRPTVVSNRQWIEQFLEYLKAERAYSDHTVEAYRMDLEQFLQYRPGKDLLRATSQDIAKFVAMRLDSAMSPISVRRQFAAIRSFYGFVLNEEGLTHNPTRCIRAPKAHRPMVRRVSSEEIEKLLASLGTEKARDLRDRALILAAYGSGLRVSELAALRIRDVDLPAFGCQGKTRQGPEGPLRSAQHQGNRRHADVYREGTP